MASMISIDKLDEKNYDTWSLQMRSVLIHNGLWKVILNQKPEATDQETWNSDVEKALAEIVLCVKPTQLHYIKNAKTATEAWNKLHEVYKPKGPAQKVSAYKKLLNLRMLEGDNAVTYVNSFTEAIDRLIEAGIGLEDNLISIILLSSLPKSFENFVVSIETRDNLPTYSTLKLKLIEEAERRTQQEKHTNCNTEKEFSLQNTKSSKKKFNGNCFICGKKGHYASKCKKREKPKESALSLIAMTNTEQFMKTSWYIDSGATSHMCNSKDLFEKYEDHSEIISMAADLFVKASGKGEVVIYSQGKKVLLCNVLYSPELKANFISIGKAVEHGMTAHFNENFAIIKDKNGEDIIKAIKQQNLFIVQTDTQKLFALSRNEIWHNRYGHLNYQSLKELSENKMVYGIELEKKDNNNCNTCMLSKIHVLPFPHVTERKTDKLLEIVHSDVCGPINIKTIGGSKYFLTMIDDKSRFVFVYFLKSKNEVFDKFKIFQAQVERQTGCKIKILRSDNGREYINNDFEEYLQQQGIQRELTVPYTPQQNGVAERANRTLVEMARCMIVHANLNQNMWAEAVATAAYLRNRCPTKILKEKTPYEVWYNKKPTVKHILRYLLGTMNLKMSYDAGDKMVECYVDADWANDSLDRKSYTGFVYFIGKCLVSWESKKQNTVALSSTEAEYVAASNAAKEAIYLRRILKEIDFWDEKPIILNIDNQGTIKIATNPVYHNRTKHIDVRYHHLRETVRKNEISVQYCPTDEMIADILTKNLQKSKHLKFVKDLNLN